MPRKDKSALSLGKTKKELRPFRFGSPLDQLPCTYLPDFGNVATFLVSSGEIIRRHVDVEGLFRKSADLRHQDELKLQAERGERLMGELDVHEVTCLVKTFFRLLPEPLVPRLFHDPLLSSVHLPEPQRTEAVQGLCFALPAPHLSCLRYFMNLLAHVATHCHNNRMNALNLAVVLTPSLIRLKTGSKLMSPEELRALPKQTALIEHLICHAKGIGCMTPLVYYHSLQMAEKRLRKKLNVKKKTKGNLNLEQRLGAARAALNVVAALPFRPNICVTVSDTALVDGPSGQAVTGGALFENTGVSSDPQLATVSDTNRGSYANTQVLKVFMSKERSALREHRHKRKPNSKKKSSAEPTAKLGCKTMSTPLIRSWSDAIPVISNSSCCSDSESCFSEESSWSDEDSYDSDQTITAEDNGPTLHVESVLVTNNISATKMSISTNKDRKQKERENRMFSNDQTAISEGKEVLNRASEMFFSQEPFNSHNQSKSFDSVYWSDHISDNEQPGVHTKQNNPSSSPREHTIEDKIVGDNILHSKSADSDNETSHHLLSGDTQKLSVNNNPLSMAIFLQHQNSVCQNSSTTTEPRALQTQKAGTLKHRLHRVAQRHYSTKEQNAECPRQNKVLKLQWCKNPVFESERIASSENQGTCLYKMGKEYVEPKPKRSVPIQLETNQCELRNHTVLVQPICSWNEIKKYSRDVKNSVHPQFRPLQPDSDCKEVFNQSWLSSCSAENVPSPVTDCFQYQRIAEAENINRTKQLTSKMQRIPVSHLEKNVKNIPASMPSEEEECSEKLNNFILEQHSKFSRSPNSENIERFSHEMQSLQSNTIKLQKNMLDEYNCSRMDHREKEPMSHDYPLSNRLHILNQQGAVSHHQHGDCGKDLYKGYFSEHGHYMPFRKKTESEYASFHRLCYEESELHCYTTNAVSVSECTFLKKEQNCRTGIVSQEQERNDRQVFTNCSKKFRKC